MFQAIHYRKTFEERLQLAQYQIDSISDASIELTKSKAIEKIFLIILALGNYMNKGARGNSPGFKLNSLSKLRDTKSADGQQTLLHYLVSSGRNPRTVLRPIGPRFDKQKFRQNIWIQNSKIQRLKNSNLRHERFQMQEQSMQK